MSNTDLRLLEIYLNDHWAGAAAGTAVADRLATNNANTEWGERLRHLANEIEADKAVPTQVRAALGFDGGSTKRTLMMAGERLARLKPNGRLLTYSPLSRLLECEGVEAGISAKRRLWNALMVGAAQLPELADFDFDELAQRAEQQLDLLREFHEYATKAAFAKTGA